MNTVKTLAAMAALAAAIIGVGYWVQSVETRLATLAAAKQPDQRQEQCATLADRLSGARGKTKTSIESAMQNLGCKN